MVIKKLTLTVADALRRRRCYIEPMNAADVITRLKAMEPELRSAGLGALYLFGSRARGEERPDSDVDLAFDLAPEAEMRFTLLDQAALINRLCDVLHTDVDFVGRRNLRPRIRERFDAEAVRVFG